MFGGRQLEFGFPYSFAYCMNQVLDQFMGSKFVVSLCFFPVSNMEKRFDINFGNLSNGLFNQSINQSLLHITYDFSHIYTIFVQSGLGKTILLLFNNNYYLIHILWRSKIVRFVVVVKTDLILAVKILNGQSFTVFFWTTFVTGLQIVLQGQQSRKIFVKVCCFQIFQVVLQQYFIIYHQSNSRPKLFVDLFQLLQQVVLRIIYFQDRFSGTNSNRASQGKTNFRIILGIMVLQISQSVNLCNILSVVFCVICGVFQLWFFLRLCKSLTMLKTGQQKKNNKKKKKKKNKKKKIGRTHL
eukprot:TRINITY_DN16332_c0_g1_i3.p1 TRINITY_DN16332_c0_g1~~TRINITY_DN16332_c0_g1_i3.p1  ORF type:complete len:298 (+),score=3.62 TRINITY_DN16332_c0_g1_i3:96-989(+)